MVEAAGSGGLVGLPGPSETCGMESDLREVKSDPRNLRV